MHVALKKEQVLASCEYHDLLDLNHLKLQNTRCSIKSELNTTLLVCFCYFGKLPKFFLPRISSENKKSIITLVSYFQELYDE